jgi:hypothetical protein
MVLFQHGNFGGPDVPRCTHNLCGSLRVQLAIHVSKHNYFQREVDLGHEGRCDFLKTLKKISWKCVFFSLQWQSEKQLQFIGGKVLGIYYTEINDGSMMVMTPDSQNIKKG